MRRWIVAKSNTKRARINAMRHLLAKFDYDGKHHEVIVGRVNLSDITGINSLFNALLHATLSNVFGRLRCLRSTVPMLATFAVSGAQQRWRADGFGANATAAMAAGEFEA
jgi:hypothetical protein